MGTKKVGQEYVRKLTKTSKGSSYYITLPKKWVKKYGWKDGQKVVVRKYKGKNKLVIEDWKPNE